MTKHPQFMRAPIVNIPKLVALMKARPEEFPSELIELVNGAILYLSTVEDEYGECPDTDGLDDLTEARRVYDGGGIIREAKK